MPFTNEDKLSIKLLHQERWGAKHICKEFSYKNWAVSSVRDFLHKIDTTNSISRKTGSGRLRTVRTEQNIEHVAELICCQEDNPGSSKSPRYWKVDRNIPQFCATSRGFGWSQGQNVHLLNQPRPTTHQQSRWSVATAIKSSSSGSRRAHWTVVFLTVWLLYAAVTWI